MGDIITYKKFATPWEAEPVIKVLKENFIYYEFIKSTPIADSIIAGQVSDYSYELLIDQDQFEQANQVLQDVADTEVGQLAEDYYLFSFSNKELKEILAKPDEWGEYDYSLARKILEERGIWSTDQQLEEIKAVRNKELAKPESDSTSGNLMITGYVFSVVGLLLTLIPTTYLFAIVGTSTGYLFSIAGPFLGLTIGLTIMNSTKILPDGKRVYTYTQKSRKDSRVLVVVALILLVFAVAVKIINNRV